MNFCKFESCLKNFIIVISQDNLFAETAAQYASNA
jgi:hypothetical protein